MTDNFTIYIPENQYLGYSASPINLTVDSSYEAGRFMSFFSGSLISSTSGSHIDDVGISVDYTYLNLDYKFNLILHDTTLLSSGSDLSYDAVVYNYYNAIKMDYYQHASLWNMAGYYSTPFAQSSATTTSNLANNLFTHGGQTFMGNGKAITTFSAYLLKTGTVTGNVYAKIFAAGSASLAPTSGSLAISDPVLATSLSTSRALQTFTFSENNQISLTKGSIYIIAVNYQSTNSPNVVSIQRSLSSMCSGSYAYAFPWGFNTADMWFTTTVDSGLTLNDLALTYIG